MVADTARKRTTRKWKPGIRMRGNHNYNKSGSHTYRKGKPIDEKGANVVYADKGASKLSGRRK